MRNYKIDLKKENYPVKGGVLECNLADCVLDVPPEGGWKRPAVIVVPGGGYGMVSKREGEPVSNFFLAKGFQTFVLTYLCVGDGVAYPEQLFELASAVDFVKKHAKEYNVDPDEVFVVGFSAGGHLTANLAVDHQNVPKKSGVALDCKPKAVGLGYPVISSRKEIAHLGSFENLLSGYSGEAKELLLKELDLDRQVSEHTVPAFLFTTAEDNCVPPQNTLCFALALAEKKIPYELHVYPQGVHGLSTGDYEVCAPEEKHHRISAWLEDCAKFFRLFTQEKF